MAHIGASYPAYSNPVDRKGPALHSLELHAHSTAVVSVRGRGPTSRPLYWFCFQGLGAIGTSNSTPGSILLAPPRMRHGQGLRRFATRNEPCFVASCSPRRSVLLTPHEQAALRWKARISSTMASIPRVGSCSYEVFGMWNRAFGALHGNAPTDSLSYPGCLLQFRCSCIPSHKAGPRVDFPCIAISGPCLVFCR